MALGDFATLAQVKRWLGIDPSNTSDDPLLSDLISSQSRWLRSQTHRDLYYRSYSETRNGMGTLGMTPYQYPVVAVQSVTVDAQVVPPQPATVPGDPPQFGWVLSADRIEIVSYTGSLAPFIIDYAPYYYGAGGPRFTFTRGFGNVVLAYTAGFAVLAEAAAVPSSGPYTAQAQEAFASDIGVSYALTGAALAKVAGTPAVGQYAVSAGVYTFAAADAGTGVLLSYAYTPTDLTQAVVDLVAWKYRARDRVGQKSKSLGGEVVSFETDGAPPSVDAVLKFYARVQV